MEIRKVSWLAILVAVILLFSLLAGCSKAAPLPSSSSAAPPATQTAQLTTTAAPTSIAAPSTSSAPPAAITSATPSVEPAVLTIGLIINFQNAMGIMIKDGVDIMADIYNKAGGLKVGSDVYQIKIIAYDTNNTQATAVAAANRMVFQDHVKFILHDPELVETYLPITEANKVILDGGTASQATVKAGLNYSCFTAGTNFAFPIGLSWYVKNYPDLIKNYVFVAPDNQNGHFSIDAFMEPILKSLGVTPQKIFYPPSSTDISSAATKAMDLKPTTVDCVGGGSIADINAMKAIWNAGYRGQFFTGGGVDPGTANQFLPPEAVEGSISCGAFPPNFDPAPTQMAKDFKAAYIAKKGKWDYPSASVDEFNGLIYAIQKAGTLDVDKVIAVIYGGMKDYPTLGGTGIMLPRPDLGDTSGITRDSVVTNIIQQFQKSKAVPLAIISPEEGIKYYQMVHPEYQYP